MNYFSDDFDVARLAFYKLIIRTSYHEDSLMVVDGDLKVLAWFEYPFDSQPRQILKLLSLPFLDVTIYVDNLNFTLIPESLYDESKIDVYTSYFDFLERSTPIIERFHEMQVVLISQLDQGLKARWENILPDAKWSSSSLSIFHCATKFQSVEGYMLHIRLSGDRLECLLVMHGMLKFYNCYDCTTIDDVIYYVLSVSNLFEIERLDYLAVLGKMPQDEWFGRLDVLANHVIYAESTEGYQFSDEIDQPTKMEISTMPIRQACVS